MSGGAGFAGAGAGMTFEGVPGVVETKEAYGETTLVVDPARLVEACLYLRDELGLPTSSPTSRPTDYLGWDERAGRGLLSATPGGATSTRPARPASPGSPRRSRSASR